MNTSDKKTLITFRNVLIIAGIIIAGLFAFHKCADAQTAGTFDMSFPYSAAVDRAMIRQHGADWINTFIKPQLREAYKNHKNTVVETYKVGAAEIFNEDIDPELLLKSEANTLQKIMDSVTVRRLRKEQQIEDSINALGPIGSLKLDGEEAFHFATIKGPDETDYIGTQLWKIKDETLFVRPKI